MDDSNQNNNIETPPPAVEKPAKKLSGFSKWSLRLAGFAWFCLFLQIVLDSAIAQSFETENIFIEILFICLETIFLLLILASLLTAIAGIVHIIIKRKTTRGILHAVGGAALVLPLILIILVGLIFVASRQNELELFICSDHLSSLYHDTVKYSEKYGEKYPPAETWCDELWNEFGYFGAFLFPGAEPNSCENNKKHSYYAMNSDCEPNSAGNVVLFFDAMTGWNQHGGPELLAPQVHKGKGCHILFNDGTVEFVKKEDFDKLRWK